MNARARLYDLMWYTCVILRRKACTPNFVCIAHMKGRWKNIPSYLVSILESAYFFKRMIVLYCSGTLKIILITIIFLIYVILLLT